MLFEVYNRWNEVVMTTQYEECLYSDEDLRNMAAAGYKFKVDGKWLPVSKAPRKPDSHKDTNNPGQPVQSCIVSDTSKNLKAASSENNKSVNAKSSRSRGKIQCVETGEVFNSQAEAARHFNLDPAYVSDSCRLGKSVKGHTFRKIDR